MYIVKVLVDRSSYGDDPNFYVSGFVFDSKESAEKWMKDDIASNKDFYCEGAEEETEWETNFHSCGKDSWRTNVNDTNIDWAIVEVMPAH